MITHLTDHESSLILELPQPPATATFRASNIWIVEWLGTHDRKTGHELHEWMRTRRPGWSAYFPCENKNEVLAAITVAWRSCGQPGFSPVLHIEAHGSEAGLVGPSGAGEECLHWSELTPHLQRLNLATGCNLALVVAACTGFAAIQALAQGPRAPAVVLVGPDSQVDESRLLEGTKEFYRRWQDDRPDLSQICESASRELNGTAFEVEPYVLMAYEAQLTHLVKSLRPEEIEARRLRLRARMLQETNLPESIVDERLRLLPAMSWQDQQSCWNTMFMIDLFPENQDRFGVNWQHLCHQLELNISGSRAG